MIEFLLGVTTERYMHRDISLDNRPTFSFPVQVD
jgi:hypothetical protein